MKILLCNPPALKSGYQIPDIGLAYIATSLRKDGHEVDVFQSELEPDFNAFRRRITDFKPDILGLKVMSIEIVSTRKCIEIARTEFPDVVTIIGGPHTSSAPLEDIFSYFDKLDYAMRGEAEIAFPMFVKTIESGQNDFANIPGLAYRQGESFQSNPVLIHRNLDDFGMPAWDLIDPRKFPNRWYFWTPEFPGAPILTSRGCPYRCTFCGQNVVTGKMVRRRSLDLVISEMDLLLNTYGVHDFDFTDDNFLMDAEYVRQFCEMIIDRGWKIRWNCCGARLDFLDEDLVKKMDKAGCNIISVGFESGSARVLEYMKKDLDLNMVRIKSKLIAKHTNIKLMGLFILGYPTETEAEIKQTIKLALELPLFAANFNTYIVIPGCEEYERLVASGKVERVPWDKLSIDEHSFTPDGMSFKRLQMLYYIAHLKFYLRPRIVWRFSRYSWRRINQFFLRGARKVLWKNPDPVTD